jgi:L-fucose isomerase
MTRVNIIKGLGPVLQIAEGWSVELPKAMHDQLDARTNSTWPTTWFAPRLTGKGPFSDVYSVMANWGANHGVLTIGHVGADFITLASMLRIRSACITWKRRKSTAPPAGLRTGWIAKARITAPARTTARCINVNNA